jgi:intracellular septation protein
MKQFLEFIPILVFVAVYYFTDIFYATGALMVAVTVQVGGMRLAGKPIPQQLKVTLWLSLIFGGLTLVFQDKTFIQWKPTIINWVMAGAMVASQFVGPKNLVHRFLGRQLDLPGPVWTRLNLGWAFGFMLAGALNLVVAYNFSEAFWVNYKLIGGFGITLFYVIVTVVYLTAGGHFAEDANQPSKEAGTPP